MARRVDRLGAEQLTGGVEHEAGEVRVVHGDRITADQVHVDGGSMGGRHALRDAAHAFEHTLAGVFGDGPDRAEQARRVGDHVARRPRLDLGDGHDRRIEDVDPAGYEGLERLHDLARDRNRIEAVVRRRGVAPLAAHHDLQGDRKSTRLNSSHEWISYAVFCLKKKKKTTICRIPTLISTKDYEDRWLSIFKLLIRCKGLQKKSKELILGDLVLSEVVDIRAHGL